LIVNLAALSFSCLKRTSVSYTELGRIFPQAVHSNIFSCFKASFLQIIH
jgi:hypothetical protein